MLLTVGITASAQEALDSRHTIVSPEIHDDNRVTFRLKTPDHVASVRVGSDCFSSGGADLKKMRKESGNIRPRSLCLQSCTAISM